jgi:hypothetical protein
MSMRAEFAESLISGDLKRALEAVHAQLAAEHGRIVADRFLVRLRAAVLTSKRDFLVKACVYVWLGAALTGVQAPELLRRAGRTGAWFRRRFVEAGANPGELGIVLDSSGAFAVRYERLPFLTVFSLWIVEMLGYDRLEKTIAPCLRARSQASVNAEISRLCSDLRRKLSMDLPRKPDMRRFDAILSFLEARSAERRVSPRDVCDGDVFDFWREWAPRELDIGVRLFESARESFTRFLVLWSVAEAAASEARAAALDERPGHVFGTDAALDEEDFDRFAARESDDVAIASAMALFEAGDGDDENAAFLDAIERSPLKIAVATRLRRLRMFMGYPAAAGNLHRSRARGHAFDGAQRRAAGAAAKALRRADVLAHVEQSDVPGYESILDELSLTLQNVEWGLWGGVHILKENGDPDAVDLAMALSDAQMMQDVARCIDRDAPPDIDALLEDLRESVSAGRRHSALDVLFVHAESAFTRIKREGFEPTRVREAEVVAAARALAQAYRNQMAGFWRRHAQLRSAVRAQEGRTAFEEDLRLFRQAFADLYAPQE